METEQFVCPKCEAIFLWPKAVQRHASKRCLKVLKPKPKGALASGSSIASVDPLLRIFELYVNHRSGVLVCNRCQCCIGHEVTQVISHLKRVHKVPAKDAPSPLDLRASFQGIDFLSEDDIVKFPGSSEQPVGPIEGLPIHFEGRMCIDCKYLCCLPTIRHHIAASGHTQIEHVHLQTCFKGP
jgi:hypothetical protein